MSEQEGQIGLSGELVTRKASAPEQAPSVGRVVHYVSPRGGHRAAIITILDNIGLADPFISHPEVSLCVFNPDGLAFLTAVPFDADGEAHTWHWPERV